jgi:UDP-N-acetylmuramoyl-tripeptide--D-alanyl-D-alanine ligase
MMTLNHAMQWLAGASLVGDGNVRVARVHSDTRSLQAGDLFVALKGANFDANDFLVLAQAAGASAALARRACLPSGFTGIEVDDTLQALGQLAKGWRSQFDTPVVAVTGSNGKTTVTQMIASIFQAWQGAASLATQGNFNNEIGLPLTLLRLRPAHRVAVVELGMNHVGEIAHLANLAQPTVALVNNAQREHLEFMATVQAVAQENGHVISALPATGVAVFPADDAFTPLWKQLAGDRPCLRFGDGGEVQLQSAQWLGDAWQAELQTPLGLFACQLNIAGRHNLRNALAATACALAAGAPLVAVAKGLSAFQPVKGRSRAFKLALQGRTITVVDDTYNANPDSVRAAIDVLAELPGPRLLVLGDMGEVGDQGPQFHAEVGAYARDKKINKMATVGIQSAQAAINFVVNDGLIPHHADTASLTKAVLSELPHVASVLVKGSRFMQMEQVVAAITAHANNLATEPQGGRPHAA